jgi:hypothetical protein
MRTTISDGMDLARIDAGDLSPLVPPGSNVGDRQILTTAGDPSEEIALTWERGDDPFAAEHGFVVWRRAADAWTAVYAFTDRVKTGVLGLGPLRSGDLTGDGLPEIVTLEQQGGSGACGVTRVISTTGGDAREIYRSSGCDRTIDVVGDHLEVREAVFGPDDPHCCPSSFRVTTLAWDGSRFRETSTTTEPAPR